MAKKLVKISDEFGTLKDMATLNIDKSLIDQSALVQSDHVIAMQNGCFCCTLQSDLVDQIVELAQKKIFNYMVIEASGVSEPSQIAPLFDLCDDSNTLDIDFNRFNRSVGSDLDPHGFFYENLN